MNEIIIKYKYNPGDPIWFMHRNEASKGVVSRVAIHSTSNGLSSRGYKVREFFNRLLKVPSADKEMHSTIQYEIDLLHYDSENFRSCPHIKKECELYKTKQELLNSL